MTPLTTALLYCHYAALIAVPVAVVMDFKNRQTAARSTIKVLIGGLILYGAITSGLLNEDWTATVAVAVGILLLCAGSADLLAGRMARRQKTRDDQPGN